jgi:hypothetical protein
VDVGKEQGPESVAPPSHNAQARFELRSHLTMLKPTKGMGHPSPPPSLANAALRRASDGGSEGMAERSLPQQIKEIFGADDVRNYPNDRPCALSCAMALGRPH